MARYLNRRKFIAATGAAGLVGLAGCSDGGNGGDTGGNDTEGGDGGNGGNGGEETDTEGGNGGGGSSQLSWHAGGTGGTYYPLSNQFKSIVDSNTDYTLQVQSTGASVENAGSLGNGNADFALLQNDVAFFAVNGEGIDAFQGNAIPNIRGVATLYPETIHVVTPGNSDIQSVQDLSGATINTGDLGSGTQVDARQILEAVGVTDYTEQNTDFSQAAEQIQNGDVDAAFVVGGWPVGAIEDLANNSNIRLVEISGDAREQVKQAGSYFADDEIPAGTYSGIDQPVPTVAVQAMIATNEEQPEEVVQSVTAAIFENTDQINIKQEFITVDSAQDGMSIDLHPGAQAFFDSAGTGGSGNDSGNSSSGNETSGNESN
ncbi:C4-dicarboxylate ABC transporter substrate-binding protein [Haloprofundus marisrubri]|uniref:C4-dicarboxylate ABC transporter substrate-binding protein n=1 Tax=Haloprofundus marisrubri TaxID=1514971 RepID=A0A0W1RDV9_9EURY|nr:TAXI family TRAP transporter solute-binding subunit [Haloprofundus marisrubri]KTG11662.1 C4-dicarboxylate ABC transporter substrate-binding protein [Haloprofundus marisrubri]